MSLKYYWVWVAATIFAALAAVRWVAPPNQALVLMGLVLASHLVGMLYLTRFVDAMEPFNVDSEIPDDLVDPWLLQRRLMEASDQRIASSPSITNMSVLYAALILEESGETYEAMLPALAVLRDLGTTPEARALGAELHNHFNTLASFQLCESTVIRQLLKEHASQEFTIELTPAEAKPLFDGTIDIAVVNCGFALASGFDGSAGYAETVGSNLSKRNPETGKIDKTPDGKWIKGVNYREPDLIAVMRRTAHERAMPFNSSPAW